MMRKTMKPPSGSFADGDTMWSRRSSRRTSPRFSISKGTCGCVHREVLNVVLMVQVEGGRCLAVDDRDKELVLFEARESQRVSAR